MIEKKSKDVLAQKKQRLNTYLQKYDNAVSLVTGIIETLTQTSADIENTIKEIDEYTNELVCTAGELQRTKEKNDKVIKNFRKLIEE